MPGAYSLLRMMFENMQKRLHDNGVQARKHWFALLVAKASIQWPGAFEPLTFCSGFLFAASSGTLPEGWYREGDRRQTTARKFLKAASSRCIVSG